MFLLSKDFFDVCFYCYCINCVGIGRLQEEVHKSVFDRLYADARKRLLRFQALYHKMYFFKQIFNKTCKTSTKINVFVEKILWF